MKGQITSVWEDEYQILKRRNTMQESLSALWAKASGFVAERKNVLIPVAGLLAGALIGAAVATMVANAQDDLLLEEILTEQLPVESVASE